MAKQTVDYGKNLDQLITNQRKRFDPEPPDPVEPTVQLVLSFLQWNATISRAERAYATIINHVVDLNELRVSHLDESLPLIGEDYPEARNRLARIKEAMNEVYLREHSMAMNSIMQASKKDQRAYLDTLPGIRPYVAAQVALLSFEAHAMPVDEKLAALLQRERCSDPGMPPAKAESFICRHVKAGEAGVTHLALQHWADGRKTPRAALADLEPAPVPEPEARPTPKSKTKAPGTPNTRQGPGVKTKAGTKSGKSKKKTSPSQRISRKK